MGKRKRLAAEARKAEKKVTAIASLNNTPTSTRRMRVTADTIRGKNVEHALNILNYSQRHSARNLEKLLRSAIKNWEMKNEGQRVEDSQLYVKTVFVDPGVTIKRFLPAPQGRAYRLRKRSNHVTLIVDSRLPKPIIEEAEEVKEEEVVETTAAETAEVKETAKVKTKSKPKAAAKKTAKKPEKKKTDKKEKPEKKSPAKKGTKKK